MVRTGENLPRNHSTAVGAAAIGAIERNLLQQFEISDNEYTVNHDEGMYEFAAIIDELRMEKWLQTQDKYDKLWEIRYYNYQPWKLYQMCRQKRTPRK